MDPLLEGAARSPGSNYDDEELAFAKSLYRFDFTILPFFVIWYFFIAWSLQPAEALVEQSPAPTWVLVVQALLAVGSLGVLLVEIHMPPPRKEDDIYHSMIYAGWWITLTRHCLTLQMVHSFASFIGTIACVQCLMQLTNGMTFIIGSLGWFVTVQYFSLVHYNPEFKERCERMAKAEPPVFIRARNVFIHSPALLIAVLDTTLAKSRANLASECSRRASFAWCVLYCFLYVGLLLINYRATGYYPYAVLKELVSWQKWAAFAGVQCITTCIFCSIECVLAAFVPSVW